MLREEVMAADMEAPPEVEPLLLERGRYALTQMPDGGWVITRARPICERCEECGCGEQQDGIPVPSMFVPFLTGQAQMTPGGAMGMIRKMMGNGNGH
jgi:hypothetical protein